MPPFDEGAVLTNCLYLVDNNGNTIAWNGIEAVETVTKEVPPEEEKKYATLCESGRSEMQMEIMLTHRDRRKWKKFFHKILKKTERERRYKIRFRERVRRAKLKGQTHVWVSCKYKSLFHPIAFEDWKGS